MKAKVYSPTRHNIKQLGAKLRRGEIVAIPTETVYGLAGNALNADACAKIFRAKGRPANDPLIVHVLDLKEAETLAVFTPQARKIAELFWPGPLTLVLPKKAIIPAIVTSGGTTVAIRAPAHPVARRILRASGVPLAAPSANSFGYISPTEAGHVLDNLGMRIESILDGGSCDIGVESTILDLTNADRPRILRSGLITAHRISLALKPLKLTEYTKRSNDAARQLAPGMLSRHYSPQTKMDFITPGQKEFSKLDGVIYLRKPANHKDGNIYWLSNRGGIKEVAKNLYRVLRTADAANHRQIWVEPVPPQRTGLAMAIKDRLVRAVAK